VALEFKFYCTY